MCLRQGRSYEYMHSYVFNNYFLESIYKICSEILHRNGNLETKKLKVVDFPEKSLFALKFSSTAFTFTWDIIRVLLLVSMSMYAPSCLDLLSHSMRALDYSGDMDVLKIVHNKILSNSFAKKSVFQQFNTQNFKCQRRCTHIQ